jgi:GxxExxY protein
VQLEFSKGSDDTFHDRQRAWTTKDTKVHEGKPINSFVMTILAIGFRIGDKRSMPTVPFQRSTTQEISHAIITAAMRVHSALGPGLLESAYTACLQHELKTSGFKSDSQVGLPVIYDGVKLDLGYRIDLLVEDLVIVELKSVDAIAPVHQTQIISYLKLSGRSLGLLINFNVTHLKDGIKRFVNGTGWQ